MEWGRAKVRDRESRASLHGLSIPAGDDMGLCAEMVSACSVIWRSDTTSKAGVRQARLAMRYCLLRGL